MAGSKVQRGISHPERRPVADLARPRAPRAATGPCQGRTASSAPICGSCHGDRSTPRPASRAGLHAADEPARSGFTLRRAFVLLGKAGESFGLALALFGSQVRHARRVLLPVGMAADLRIAEDGGIDADWRT